MKQYNIRFAYHRPDLFDADQKEMADSAGILLRPMTVAYQKVAESEASDSVTGINCAISICNIKDNFQKALGREHSTKRLVGNDPKWTFSLSNDQMVMLVQNSVLDPFELINENFAPLLLNFMKHSAISRFVVAEAAKVVNERGL